MVKKLLEERQKTHGDFSSNAIYSQYLKSFFRICEGWENMSPVQQEAMDLMALKMSRILSGQADFDDHWDDIAGYAELGKDG